MELLSTPLAAILKWFSTLFGGNFAAAVFFFTLLVNLLMLPLTIKSQRASANQARLRPKLEVLKKKCGDDKLKFQKESQDLQTRENVSLAGGCLPMIIRLVIMLGVYEVITSPLRYLAGVDAGIINDALFAAKDAGLIKETLRGEISLLPIIKNGSIEIAGVSSDILSNMDFSLFGLNLTERPEWGWNIFSAFKPIWLIPIASFLSAVGSSVVSMAMQKKANPDAPNMAGMMLTVPIISLVIAFGVPGAVGFYWTVSSIISTIIQTIVQMFYSPAKIIARDTLSEVIKKNNSEVETIKKASAE